MTLLPLNGHYIFSKTPWLNWAQLLFGLDKGYIDEQGVSSYICDSLTNSSPEQAYEIATMAPTEQNSIRVLLQSLANKNSQEEIDVTKPWIFLLLSHLLENKEQFEDPLQIIEELYSDFDYPEEIAPLVRYMPLPDGVEGSENRLYENWKTALSDYKELFSKESH
ncbi:hypothetical protein PS718_01480 [Pseudomonas fluorescens]|uniref:DUF2247 domain-containing protein n=1 Tax=Pseudomonas fluorescens TaxID=294 RepID=A0A5E7B493_PSEFL|nr:DUF2247 family protein [Pseudomonas fluorescens]VVN85795.1 hypothetical protein PS718_01480 [Pseudomonas fluorescens]